jgi:hypothetical protein
MLAALAVFTAGHAAAWSTVPSINTEVTTIAGSALLVDAIADGNGGAIVAWEDDRLSAQQDIYAQRLDEYGNRMWGNEDLPVSTASGYQWFPRLATDGEGGAIVFWEDARSGSSVVYAQRITSAGVTMWTPGGVRMSATGVWQYNQFLVPDGSGGAFMTFMGDFPKSNIYAQRVDKNGNRLWGDKVLVCNAAGNLYTPRLAPDGLGGIVTVWYDPRAGSGTYDLYAQRVNGSGDTQWAANGIPVCTAPNAQDNTFVISDGTTGTVVFWEDDRLSTTDQNIYGQHLDENGNALWGADGKPVVQAARTQTGFRAMSDGAGGYFATWHDFRTGGYDPYVHRIDGDGNDVWTSGGIALVTLAGDQAYCGFTGDGAGGFVVAWADRRNGSHYDIYAKRINASGGAVWGGATGIAVSTMPLDQRFTRVLPDNADGAIAVFATGGTAYDIHAQHISVGGSLPVGASRVLVE